MLLGKKAPHFVAPAIVNGHTIDDFSLEQYLDKKYVLLFFYPADFSGLCPTEILAFQEREKDFEALGVQVVGCSVDSKFAHLKWLEMPIDKGGIAGVKYPLIADKSMTISMAYEALAGHYTLCSDDKCDCKDCCGVECQCGCNALKFEGLPMAYRATVLIDKAGKIRHQSINEFAMGRDVEEFIRLVEGVKLIDETGSACPANWKSKK